MFYLKALVFKIFLIKIIGISSIHIHSALWSFFTPLPHPSQNPFFPTILLPTFILFFLSFFFWQSGGGSHCGYVFVIATACHIWRTVFCSTPPHPAAFTSLLSFSCDLSWVGRVRGITDVLFRAKHSILTLSALTSYESLQELLPRV